MTFNEQVYKQARAIPPGRVASYGQLAMMAGRPGGARIAGWAMGRCRDQTVPCHRVVRQDGSLAPDGAFGAPGLQRQLLLDEGVAFLPDGRVDMARCQWDGK